MPSPSVLFDPFRMFNSENRLLGNFSRSILDETAYESCKWKVLDVIPQEFISILFYYAKLRHWFYSWKRNIICPLWKKHDISNTRPAFIETNLYWGSFSKVQSIFILCLSKQLLQVTGWLGELQQIAGSHSPTLYLGYIKRHIFSEPRFEENPRCHI